ncbi:MAG: proton-conducting transporter membrane subunit [Chloroflexaceae bacterium]|nr:proton-conducting transporter membrane subunit [Chloroflexaceae bacterium]
MLLTLVFSLLLGCAALAFGLNRLAPTRTLGLATGTAVFVAAALMLLMPVRAIDQAPVEVLTIGGARFSFWPAPGVAERVVAAALLGSGGTALLSLAGATPPAARGFGGVFAWATIALAAALLSVVTPAFSLVHPVAWSVVAIASYGALRASGAMAQREGPPLMVTTGLGASLVLMVSLLVAGPDPGAGRIPAWPAAAGGVLAALGLAGCAPLLHTRDEAALAPAPLGALVFGLAAPAAALSWLLQSVAALPSLPPAWGVTLGLIGGLGAFASAAGALGERRLRAILNWTWGFQAALIVAAAGLAAPRGAAAGVSLLLGLLLSSVVAASAAAILEQRTGSDEYTAIGGAPRLAALAWATGMLVSLGLPPLWGFWGRLWFLQAAQEHQPWLAALTLAASVLLTLALLAPLAAMLGPARAPLRREPWTDAVPLGLAGSALLALGVAPQFALRLWPGDAPVTPVIQGAAIGAGLLLAILGLLMARAAPTRALERDPDEEPAWLAPEGLGTFLQPVSWLARPMPLLRGAWLGLQRASELLRVPLTLFEQRYYLLGVLAALLTIMLLMAR